MLSEQQIEDFVASGFVRLDGAFPRALAEAGEEQILGKRDPELLANIHRQLGDLALAAGNLDATAQAYRRAAFYAFIFQAIPEPGDTYTVAFYREITGRISARVATCLASGKRRLHRTARDLSTLGLATACAAAVPGVVDYVLAVPPHSSAKERATKHALGNVSALALFAAARTGRNGSSAPPSLPGDTVPGLCDDGSPTPSSPPPVGT